MVNLHLRQTVSQMYLLKHLLYESLWICETSGHESAVNVVEPMVVHPELFRIVYNVLQVWWNA